MLDDWRVTLELVIFDCDGVLIDSEPVSRILLAEVAKALGWAITPDYATRFTGLTWTAIKPVFEAEIGRALPADWPATLQDRLVARLSTGVAAIEGARAVLEAVTALGLPYRIASNSSHEEMAAKFASAGLASLVAGRVHSARDVAAGKPAPDLFLAAAHAQDVAPEACLVVEDSGPGMAAAHAAGMRVVAFAPEGLPAGLADQPHFVVGRLAELPLLLGPLVLESPHLGQAA